MPDSESLDRALVRALEVLDAAGPLAERLTAATAEVEAVDRELRGTPGLRALLGNPQDARAIAHRAEQASAQRSRWTYLTMEWPCLEGPRARRLGWTGREW